MEGYFWCSLFILEAIIIVVLNMFTIIVFTKDRRVRKYSSYLLINLSSADKGVRGLVIATHGVDTLSFYVFSVIIFCLHFN